MEISNLGEDRFLRRDANQSDRTKSAVYTAWNPAPKRGDDRFRKLGRPKGSEEDDGAPQVLTGTVITSCFIQTSALPSRIELQGNDLTFFDDTFTQGGKVIGDTSRLIFTDASGKSGELIEHGFIMEKRASVYGTYDNVLSWYALPAKVGFHNYMFIARSAFGDDAQRNVDAVVINVNRDTELGPPTPGVGSREGINGLFRVEYSEDGVTQAGYNPIFAGNSELFFSGLSGFSSCIQAGGGGLVGLAYRPAASSVPRILLYMLDETAVNLGADLIPDVTGAYDIGSPSFKIGTLYGSVVACPLPTVEDALALLAQIEAPTFVGARGHYGEDRKYFDDLTFPPELLYTDRKGRTDIEHNHMLGFLLKAVIELSAKVDALEKGS